MHGFRQHSSKTTAWIFKESKWGEEAEWTLSKSATIFLNSVCTILGPARVTVVYLLWIWRERHGGKFLIGRVVFHAPSIKLKFTYVNILLVVAICPSF